MIIVTRPSPYGEELTQLCHQASLSARHLPFFYIVKGNDLSKLQYQLNQLQRDDIVIIVSPQVSLIIQSQQVKIEFPDFVNYFAVGQHTAKLFQKMSKRVVNYPWQNENSEGLIQYLLSNSIPINQRQVLILCGDTGRTLIKDTLSAQGALVKNVHCYQRDLIDYPASIFKDNEEYIFVITSIEHLLQLERYCTDNHKQHSRLIVSSVRIMDQAKLQHWRHIYLVKNANNQNLFKTIASLCHNAPITYK